jgi:hypothetical protein
MKLSIILQEVILPTNLKILLGRLKDEGYTMLGSGDNGIALQKGNQVLKLTTDIDELRHAEKLLNHSFTSIIPIKKVEVLGPKSGIIEMVDAQPLAQEEKEELNSNSTKAEDYLIYGGELSNNLSDKMKEFLMDLKEAFTQSGIDTDEIDWSANNIMNFQGRYVLVDV